MTADTNTRLTVPQRVLPLPGKLDDIPVFISNSPEIVLQSGVLLSTFPAESESTADAHLDHTLSGRFDVFFHHITDASKAVNTRTLYLGLLIGNASDKTVHVRILSATSYLTRPDSPFTVHYPVVDNDDVNVYAGPGDRVMLDVLCGLKQDDWDESITLGARETKLVFNLPIPVNALLHKLNGRSGFIRLESDGPVYMAMLSEFAQNRGFLTERHPALSDYHEILKSGSLVQPRDRTPSPPGAAGELIYGRTAGVAKGSAWRGTITNDKRQILFSIDAGETVSYPISTVASGTLGTDQIQAAPLIVRYSDTGYAAHGNYSVLYELTLPLYNSSASELLVGLTFQSPIKNSNETDALRFFKQPPNATVFRGTIKFEWKDKNGKEQIKLVHLVQKQGQMQDSLVEFALAPGEQFDVKFSMRYPPDCTPPHVLTVSAKSGK